MFSFHLSWALEVITCISDSDSNSCFRKSCAQIMLSNFQNIYNPFSYWNNWQNSDVLGSQFPIHIANISRCSTILLTVVLSMTSVHDPILMHVYRPANNSCLCVVGLAHGSQCHLFSNCCHWNQHVYSTPYMMSSWSFSTLQNTQEFAVALFSWFGQAFFCVASHELHALPVTLNLIHLSEMTRALEAFPSRVSWVYVHVSTPHSHKDTRMPSWTENGFKLLTILAVIKLYLEVKA